jgi:hypothetical protein
MTAIVWIMNVRISGVVPGSMTFPVEDKKSMLLEISRTDDFEVTGDGCGDSWKKADWIPLSHRKGSNPEYGTDMKILYSISGLYILFRCVDGRLTAALDADFLDLWKEDVVEVFLWPDERDPLYFEYELSPLDHELPILVPNLDGHFWGWRPWHYEGERRTRHATAVSGGEKRSGSSVREWTAECFIPFSLLKPMRNVPPSPGTRWRANFYRCDYDAGPMAYWSWQPVETTFHECHRFGILVFK